MSLSMLARAATMLLALSSVAVVSAVADVSKDSSKGMRRM
jgi:heme/copper-type cytochrome/quinol oxidase subunit 3